MVKIGHGILDHGALKSAVYQKIELMKELIFFIGWAWSKMGIRPFRSYGTLKSGASHI